MKRRDFLACAPAFGAMMLSMPAQAALQGDLAQTGRAVWESWKSAFLSSDGRVIDGLQQQSSHSEGQGYGMFLATVFDDAASFRQMYQWTERHLAIRPDALLAWRWLPGQANPVPDRNNATDGDLFYAWALVRAAARFRDRSYLERAQGIAAALAETCILPMPGRSDQLVLLPATFGFQHDSHLSLNPSYYMPLAMREVAAATGTPALAACAQSGEALLHEIAREGLVPDWVDVTPSGLRASEALSANAGYEALRVPLFLIWSRVPDHMAVRRMAAVYERTVQPGVAVPTVIEPLSGVVLESSADPGYQALAGLTVCSSQRGLGATIPPFSPDQPYYPATLQLFAVVAVHETLPECVPL
ncbi:MAG: glycosyl hydrolase family 5 [Natronohydrobacter sp.]|nr:glycosyl hydrolase family 5 [Natronohydrobacter sp.]